MPQNVWEELDRQATSNKSSTGFREARVTPGRVLVVRRAGLAGHGKLRLVPLEPVVARSFARSGCQKRTCCCCSEGAALWNFDLKRTDTSLNGVFPRAERQCLLYPLTSCPTFTTCSYVEMLKPGIIALRHISCPSRALVTTGACIATSGPSAALPPQGSQSWEGTATMPGNNFVC